MSDLIIYSHDHKLGQSIENGEKKEKQANKHWHPKWQKLFQENVGKVLNHI